MVNSLFGRVAAIVLPLNEGAELDLTYSDTGNWTGGAIGVGELRGSRWGISAASYPDVDIAALTWPTALDIYHEDFWTPIDGDELGALLGTVVFDASINHGLRRVVPWLQAALGVRPDGIIGKFTRAALVASDRRAVAIEVTARRILFMPGTRAWVNAPIGMARRLARVPFEAADAAAS